MMRNACRTALFVMMLVAATASTAAACPGCKEATSDQSLNLARGFSYSILFMMPIPFIIVGGFGGYVYYTLRRRDAESVSPPANGDESRSDG